MNNSGKNVTKNVTVMSQINSFGCDKFVTEVGVYILIINNMRVTFRYSA